MSDESITIRIASPDEMQALEQMREPDAEAGPADRRMARYLRNEHHPGFALTPRVVMIAWRRTTPGNDTGDDAPDQPDSGNADEPVGYIGGHRTQRFDCDGELQYLYVTPEARRSGVASALFEHLRDWFLAHGIHRVCVDVEPSNARARSFYRAHGATDLNPHWLVWPNLRE